ncbi:PDZ domain-containing protein [Flavivirga spongiicola]|uniref:PDZ domain-containing protein n=1 Tax=Flavivirga spongiicola TaxID=421621 RepID=A0ABU7XS40_9FLAO|nr:PDZ domain-containing protein [Flavivirga sp. MEBiC05379]MDO5978567.1 PDZ domain-containing protein [Flavivirga sp. MEBiC05379]
MRYSNLSFFLILTVSFSTLAQELPRRASFEAKIGWPNNKVPGATIKEVTPNSPLDKAGIKVNDVIISVNGRKVLDQEDWSAITYAIRANKPTLFELKRGQEYIKKDVKLNSLPKEKHPKVDTFYETVTSDYGIKQRAIITKPKGNKKFPAIILIQGLSCSTIEEFSNRSNNWVKLIKDLTEKSNMVLMRIDKPGVGDSEGDCGKVDFLTELNGYESAVKVLKSKSYVDTSKIIVYGNSMGSALAPYLANKFDLAGVISDGTFYKSWYEHMLEIERRILQIEGKSEAEIYKLINEVFIPLYYEMLIKKRSFEDILEDNPTYKKYHRQGLNHMYGRPMAYYYQVQDFNFAKNWEEVKVPVRIRWGTNDWIMTENDNDMIIAILDAKGHKNHKLYKYTDLDHWSTIHTNYSSSFNFKPGKWDGKISQQIIDWAWEIIK